ncbi:MAG: flagellar motor protein MotB [Lachnospiraceae bacterium]|nr:flagellar motor protein MotB [Lachnospiraceae bacterium]
MAKKKNEEVKQGLAEWMGTFSDMMTLLMCFFVMLFSMSSIDAAKFEEVAQSFQQTVSIFKGGAKAIGDGILISNGVSQLNQLDEYYNTTGKTAESDSDELEFKENAQGMDELTEKLGATEEEMKDLQKAISELEEEKMKLSEKMAEKMEEALSESMMEDKIDVEFNSNCVILSLNGAFLFDSGQAELKEEAKPVLNKIGVLLSKYADSIIEIEGHTDSVPLNGGRYENNDVLSSYRALTVFNYLKENAAIDPGIMKHSGRGEYLPIADNSTPEGRAKNRRVEIKIYNSLSAY